MISLAKLNLVGEKKTIEEQKEILQKELDNMTGKSNTEVKSMGDEYEIQFKKSKRYYRVDSNGNIELIKNIEDNNPGDITKNQEGEILDGSAERPYEVCSVEDLIRISVMSNENYETFSEKTIKIVNNLNLKSDISYSNPLDTQMFGDYNKDGVVEGIKSEINNELQSGFIPIKGFDGILLGNNKKISNIYINNTDKSNLLNDGFIRKNNGTIKDLSISGNVIGKIEMAEKSHHLIGGIVVENNGTIEKCINEIKIYGEIGNLNSGWIFCGGIAGRNNGKIKDSKNKGYIEVKGKADNRIGGLVGYNYNGTVENSENIGDLKVESIGDFANVGGLVAEGYNSQLINSYNMGKIESYSDNRTYVGGISSYLSNSKTINCFNKGEIILGGRDICAGGLLEASSGTTVTNCYNSGKITVLGNAWGGIHIGGILGHKNTGDTIKNVYNICEYDMKANITNKGGLFVNFSGNTIDNCYYIARPGFEEIGKTGITPIDCGSKTEEEMKTDNFIQTLNKGDTQFVKDNNNINGGFPILQFQN